MKITTHVSAFWNPRWIVLKLPFISMNKINLKCYKRAFRYFISGFKWKKRRKRKTKSKFRRLFQIQKKFMRIGVVKFAEKNSFFLRYFRLRVREFFFAWNFNTKHCFIPYRSQYPHLSSDWCLEPMDKALKTPSKHAPNISSRWDHGTMQPVPYLHRRFPQFLEKSFPEPHHVILSWTEPNKFQRSSYRVPEKINQIGCECCSKWSEFSLRKWKRGVRIFSYPRSLPSLPTSQITYRAKARQKREIYARSKNISSTIALLIKARAETRRYRLSKVPGKFKEVKKNRSKDKIFIFNTYRKHERIHFVSDIVIGEKLILILVTIKQ